MGEKWLKEGIEEIRKELRQWPDWKRTTASQEKEVPPKQAPTSSKGLYLPERKK